MPVEVEHGEDEIEELAHGMHLAGRDHVIVGAVDLQHQPHRLHEIARESPIALCLQVPEVELVLQADPDARRGAGDLARDEGLSAPRTLVIEKDPVGRVHAVRFAVVLRDVEGIRFRAPVRAAGIERRRLALGRLDRSAIHLGRRCLVETRHDPDLPDRFEQPDGPEPGDLRRILGDVEADADVALRSEVVHFVGLDAAQDRLQRRRVVQIAVVEPHSCVALVRVAIEMLDPLGVERAGPANDAVNLMALAEQQLGEIAAVLPGDAGDQRLLHRIRSFRYHSIVRPMPSDKGVVAVKPKRSRARDTSSRRRSCPFGRDASQTIRPA